MRKGRKEVYKERERESFRGQLRIDAGDGEKRSDFEFLVSSSFLTL